MPAAAWAARSGDPVLFVNKDSVPKPTIDALAAGRGRDVYALGPPSAISDKALTNAGKSPRRTWCGSGTTDPVANAIDFARYSNGSFGWNINDPGHGFVIASDTDPMDAAAAAPLSASGDLGAAPAHRRRRAGPRVASRVTCSTSSRATWTTRPGPSTTTSG